MSLPYTRTTTVKAIPTVTAGAYSTADAVGGLLTFANAVRGDANGGVASADANSGEVRSVVILDKAAQTTVTYELWLFNASITATADNDAWAMADADGLKCIGVIPVTSFAASSAASIGTARSVGLAFTIPSGTNLYGQLVCRTAAPTYGATSDVQISVVIAQD